MHEKNNIFVVNLQIFFLFASSFFLLFCGVSANLCYVFVLKVIGDMEMRELIAAHAMLDYEKPMPNPRHEKGRPGGGN